MNNGHQIQQLSPANGVLHHMQARTHPHRHVLGAQNRWQFGLQEHGAVSQVAGEMRGSIAQHLRPELAPQAIGADQGFGH